MDKNFIQLLWIDFELYNGCSHNIFTRKIYNLQIDIVHVNKIPICPRFGVLTLLSLSAVVDSSTSSFGFSLSDELECLLSFSKIQLFKKVWEAFYSAFKTWSHTSLNLVN